MRRNSAHRSVCSPVNPLPTPCAPHCPAPPAPFGPCSPRRRCPHEGVRQTARRHQYDRQARVHQERPALTCSHTASLDAPPRSLLGATWERPGRRANLPCCLRVQGLQPRRSSIRSIGRNASSSTPMLRGSGPDERPVGGRAVAPVGPCFVAVPLRGLNWGLSAVSSRTSRRDQSGTTSCETGVLARAHRIVHQRKRSQ